MAESMRTDLATDVAFQELLNNPEFGVVPRMLLIEAQELESGEAEAINKIKQITRAEAQLILQSMAGNRSGFENYKAALQTYLKKFDDLKARAKREALINRGVGLVPRFFKNKTWFARLWLNRKDRGF